MRANRTPPTCRWPFEYPERTRLHMQLDHALGHSAFLDPLRCKVSQSSLLATPAISRVVTKQVIGRAVIWIYTSTKPRNGTSEDLGADVSHCALRAVTTTPCYGSEMLLSVLSTRMGSDDIT